MAESTIIAAIVNMLTVELAERSYPILIGPGLLSNATVFAAHVPHGSVLLVSNTTVAPLYASALKAGLKDRNIVEAILPDGGVV